ncbi:small, acid-soluble spore protein, H family [Proteiniborus sp.]|uniref:small, acid-soluble spore protein, H family n=1 Tax=Proteiniborus sp. TaxID=2079015 RepID=UPI003318555C
MITNRANEILNQNRRNIEVLHNGNQVWLEGVNSLNNTAQVRVLENNQNIIVPIDELNETGRELK